MRSFTDYGWPKINLSLSVHGRWPDGMHHLSGIVAFVRDEDVADMIEVTFRDALDHRPGLSVSGPFAQDLVGDNLIERAIALLADRVPGFKPPAVRLEKRLPVASGIGGGSADVAAFLRIMRDHDASLAAAQVDWTELALKLGADVPLCLASRLGWMVGPTGNGIELIDSEPLTNLAVVLVNAQGPARPTKTRDVFQAHAAPVYDQPDHDTRGRARPSDVAASPNDAGLMAYLAAYGKNDLTAAAISIMPEIKEVLAALSLAAPGQFVAMAGAGPTCFALAPTLSEARAIASDISVDHPNWWVRAGRIG